MSDDRRATAVFPFPPEYRASGLLLHVTSLPSRFGIGDVGPAAMAWIDQLYEAGQSWWQALPLGPTGYGNSPYQSLSSFAGNGLLISPDWLIEDGLLRASDCAAPSFSATAAVAGTVPAALHNQRGIAIAKRTYKAYRDLLSSPRWQRIYNAGARPQRLLWASTGTKDPKASDVLYIKALAAPFTVNTMPEGTLKALADHGDISEIMAADGGECEAVLDQFAKADVDINALATRLQDEGAKAFVNSWNELMDVIASKSITLANAK